MEKYQLNDSERTVLERLMIPFAIYQFLDNRVVTILLSEGFCDLFGYSDREKAYYDMDNNMYRDTHPEDVARAAEAAVRFATVGEPLDVIYRSKKSNSDRYIVIHSKGEHVYTAEGVRLAYVWYTDEGEYSEDVHLEKAAMTKDLSNSVKRENTAAVSRYEYLTGLPSMSYFFELAIPYKEKMVKKGRYPACLFMNFSRLRYYNRRHGFSEGDKLLRAFASLLADYFGNEYCSRFGSDHFGVITDDEGLDDKLKDLLEDAKELNDGLSLPVHIGIHLQRQEDVSVGMSLDRAKVACDSLKGRYSSEISYYDVKMSVSEELQQYIVSNIDKAISEGWIKVYFQPIVRAVNGRVCDEEGLARWIDPVYGFMSPGEFIPVLENARLIYKLDLFILDKILEKMQIQKDHGLHLVPQSVNLSRSDFDSCDIVSEICRRVDRAGFDHSLINIEITESIIGDDFEFMREQVGRFHQLGFRVWMDDFGSGYSSLDVLQSIDFDLIKFDMHFLHSFDKGDKAKIILTQLIDMASSLGIDTICEGVETLEQVRFLREAGCSMLQGYYYLKPVPLEAILERYEKDEQIGFENPEESGYYESIGKLNLHDLAMISQEESGEIGGFFNTTPMAILEVRERRVRFMRNNQAYRDFMVKYMGMEISEIDPQFSSIPKAAAASYIHAARELTDDKDRSFIDEQLPDGTTVHYFVRKIAENPRKKTIAVAIAILSVMDSRQGATYAGIARALAADYSNLFYVDMETEKFLVYTSGVGKDDLDLERHGSCFFKEAVKDACTQLYPPDLDAFLENFTKENLLEAFRTQGMFTMSYRQIVNGEPVYMNMKATPMMNDKTHVIIGVSNVDSQMKHKEYLERAKRDQIAFGRMRALSSDYLSTYIVDPETGFFSEYTAVEKYKGLGIEKTGEDFFGTSAKNAGLTVAPESLDYFLKNFTKENVMKEIALNGLFSITYYLQIDGEKMHVNTRAALVKEDDSDKLIVGIITLGSVDR